MSQVSAIIVNWNTGKLLAKCVQSLRALPEADRLNHVVIIDNASTDNSMKQAEKAANGDTRFSFVRSGENLGFARANNVGIKRLGKNNNDHILLLNPDTEMKAGSLKALLAALENNPRVAVAGPKLLNPDGSLQPSVRRLPTFTVLAGLFLKLQRLFPRDTVWQKYFAKDFDYEKEQEVEQVMGACFCIRREALDDIGLLDERFWVWFEEVDFCARAAGQDWQVLYTPHSQVIHHGGVSFHQLTGWKKSWPFMRSALVYVSKHFSFLEAVGLAAFVPAAALLTLPASFGHRVKQQHNKKRL